MITLDPALLDRIFFFIRQQRVGPSHAISRDMVMAMFGLDAKNPAVDRAFRAWYSAAGIASCEHGLYAPRNSEDVDICRAYLWPHMSPDRLRDRIEAVYRAFPKCRPERGEQLELRLP